jgi:hypothetical protein
VPQTGLGWATSAARGDQQVDGVNYKETDLHAPTLKAAEGRLLTRMAIAAANGHKIYKTDTKQAYLYGEMGEDVVYLNPPDYIAPLDLWDGGPKMLLIIIGYILAAWPRIWILATSESVPSANQGAIIAINFIYILLLPVNSYQFLLILIISY